MSPMILEEGGSIFSFESVLRPDEWEVLHWRRLVVRPHYRFFRIGFMLTVLRQIGLEAADTLEGGQILSELLA